VRPMPEFRNTRKSHRVTLSDNTTGPYFEVSLDRRVQAEFDDLVSNPAATGSGYVVRRNTIRNHRARGMLLKADDGLVQENTIDGSTMGGIVLTPEFWWNEAGYSRHVSVQRNIVRHVASAPGQLGAVLIGAMDAIDNTPAAGCGHRYIVLEGNRFEDLNGVNLFVSSTCEMTLRDNFFVRAQHASVAGRKDPLIVITQADDVRFVNNLVSNLGPFNQILVQTNAGTRVEGVGRGVRIRRDPRSPK